MAKSFLLIPFEDYKRLNFSFPIGLLMNNLISNKFDKTISPFTVKNLLHSNIQKKKEKEKIKKFIVQNPEIHTLGINYEIPVVLKTECKINYLTFSEIKAIYKKYKNIIL